MGWQPRPIISRGRVTWTRSRSRWNLDPLEFRLRNLKDERQRAVLIAAAEKFGWGKQKPAAGHGFGLAIGFEKGSYLAACAEVAVEGGRPKIERVVEAFECGAVVNPDQSAQSDRRGDYHGDRRRAVRADSFRRTAGS